MLMLALVGSFVMVGCAPATPPTPSGSPTTVHSGPSAPQSESATPSPSTTLVASAVVIDGLGFDIVDQDGVSIFRHDWPDEVDAAVEHLTRAFEFEPIV